MRHDVFFASHPPYLAYSFRVRPCCPIGLRLCVWRGRLISSPAEDIPSLYDSIAVDYRAFIRSVRRYSLTKFANFDVPSSVPSIAPPIFFNSYCLDCGKSFSSYQRLALHRKIKHGARDPVDCLINTVHCPVCMVYFHNRVRILNTSHCHTFCK